MFQKTFHITNLTCEACVKLSTMALKDIPGITSTSVDLETGTTTIESEREIPADEIIKSLQEIEKTTDL